MTSTEETPVVPAAEDKKLEETPVAAAEVEKPEEEETEKTEEKPSEDEAKAIASVAERLAFFFGDANVRQDTFMRKQLMSPEKAVSIEGLMRFNTIKQYTTDEKVLKKAAASLSELLTVSEGAIGRVKDFTADLMSKNIPVSLVISNLPTKKVDDKIRYDTTVEDVRKLFEGYGPLALIKLRFGYNRESAEDLQGGAAPNRKKGPRIPLASALVEFETLEVLEKALEDTLTVKDDAKVEPKRNLVIGGAELVVVSLQEFIEKSRKRARENGDDDDDDDGGREIKKFAMDWKPGCVIKLEGLSSTCDREQLLEAVAKGLDKSVDGVKEMKVYVDFSRGQTDGCIRFLEPDEAPALLEKLKSGGLEIAGAKVDKVTALAGEEEKQYWSDFIEFKNKQIRQREEERRGKRRKKFRR
jgi:hypothetical protein